MTITASRPEGSTATEASPFDAARRDTKAANIHGACSLQTFSSAGSLSHTHGDADGFEAYLSKFSATNFRYRDSAVQIWEYTEPYDDWQGTYGGDAVEVFYHSGHGGMDAAGVFYAPLGARWNNQDWVYSTQMQLGNERLRYLFWSTCTSLRVHDGQTPNRTWAGANRGMRMIFGWETVSWDSDVYGRRFWDHWRAGDSFSRAWMNAGWDAGHDQAPSACGIGATQAEAQNRVFNERTFSTAPATANWWWWTWYDATKSATPVTAAATEPPEEALVLRFGDLADTRLAARDLGPTEVVTPGLARISLRDGGAAESTSRRRLDDEAAFAAADRVRSALDLTGVELQPHLVRVQREAGAGGNGESVAPRVAGYAVEYRQTVDGVAVISPESGYLRVHLDAAGEPLSVDVTARPVASSRRQPVLRAPRPGDPAGTTDGASSDRTADRLTESLAARVAAHPTLSAAGVRSTPVAGSRQVGYVTDGATGFLAAQQGYRADFGHGLAKLVRVTVPLNR